MSGADLDPDGMVNAQDLAILLASWGREAVGFPDLGDDGEWTPRSAPCCVDLNCCHPNSCGCSGCPEMCGGGLPGCDPTSLDPCENEIPCAGEGCDDGGDDGDGGDGGPEPPCPEPPCDDNPCPDCPDKPCIGDDCDPCDDCDPNCHVTINGCQEWVQLPHDEPLELELTAGAGPSGGTFSWSATGANIQSEGPEATVTITEPGSVSVTVSYTVNGNMCSDTCEFEAVVVDLAVHRPPVISTSQTQIPTEDKLTVGVQTFVNLDNDNLSGLFDINETEAVDGEDEMVRVRLRLSSALDKGAAQLDAPAGAANIRVWTTANKAPDTEYQLGTPIEVPDDFTAAGDIQHMDLWVEGVAPHTAQQGTRLQLSYAGTDFQADDEAALTVIGVQQVEWVGRQNSVSDGDALNADPNWPAGLSPGSVRVFPGARFVGGAVEPTPRDRVDVKVTLTVKPVEPVTMYLRSFDVDDPTADTLPVDNESCVTCAEDNRGTIPARSGMFEGEVGGVKAHLFTEKEELVAFQTTMQPGDNFRVVVNGDRDFLLALHNNDNELQDPNLTDAQNNANKQRIVNPHVLNAPANPPQTSPTPEDAEVREAAKYVSNVLTMWRVLHLEVDSMGPVTGNYVEGHIEQLFSGDSLTADIVWVDVNLDDGSPHIGTNPPSGWGRFENGMLTIARTHDLGPIEGNSADAFVRGGGLDICAVPLPFEILHKEPPKVGPPAPPQATGVVTRVRGGSTTLRLSVTTGSLDIVGAGSVIRIDEGTWMAISAVDAGADEVTVNALRVPFRAVDDDSPEGTVIPKPDTSRMVDAFRPAYVLPREGELQGDDTLPFIANIQDVTTITTGWSFNNSALRSPRFWVAYVRGAFQSDTRGADNDPDGESVLGLGLTLGISRAVDGGVNIYWEGHNESAGRDAPNLPNPNRGFIEEDTVVHEVGHLFGCVHQDEGVMGDDGDPSGATRKFDSIDFDPRSLARIRIRSHP